MKRSYIILLILLAVASVAAWKFGLFSKKGEAIVKENSSMPVSKHSAAFNETMQQMVNAYYALTEAFVNWDTAAVSKSAMELRTALDSLKLDEMKKDSAIYPTVENQWGMVKTEITGLIGDEGLAAKRESLNMLSQQIFDLLRIVRHDASKVYYQECPMALNNYEASAFWLSADGADNKRRNPYLGLHDPKYGKGMLICGETRDSVNFVAADSTGR
jgi:hypothetical protein